MSNKIVNVRAVKKEIIQRLMTGLHISEVCQQEGMPSRATIYRWLTMDVHFSTAYRDAASMRSRQLMMETLRIADRKKKTSKDVAADKLRISTRLKLAAMLTGA